MRGGLCRHNKRRDDDEGLQSRRLAERGMKKIRVSICAFLAAAFCAVAASAATTPWSHEQDGDLGFRF